MRAGSSISLECLRKGSSVDHSNRHLLALDEHNSHVTLEVVKISMDSGLDIVFFPSHTSHALQALDVSCFILFKFAFRKFGDLWSLRNKNKEVEKQKLCKWTSRALKAALTPMNIKAGFCSTEIWLLDCIAVRHAMGPTIGFKTNADDIGTAKTK